MISSYKKGFTLIELLSVIVIIALLLFLIIPNVISILNNAKTDLYQKQLLSIEVATRVWATEKENKIILENNAYWPYVLTLGELKDLGYIEDVINPMTNLSFPDTTFINISYENNDYVYEVDEGTNDSLAPIFSYNSSNVSAEIGSVSTVGAIETLIGSVTAADPNGNALSVQRIIKKNNVLINFTVDSSNITPNVISSYSIFYTASYTDAESISHTATVIIKLKFVDTTAPVITCSSCSGGSITIEATDSYTFPEVTITDNSSEEISPVIMGSFSSKIIGTKKVIYKATDSSGNTGSYELNITVVDTTNPTFTYATSVEGDNVLYTITAADSGSGIKEYSFDGGNIWQTSNIGYVSCLSESTANVNLLVRDYAGNIANKVIETPCVKEQLAEFAYTGAVQTFTAEYNGYYKLEVWGAQGGGSGGYGAYSTGVVYLNKDEVIYVYVGGTTANGTGGYNGGGTITGNVYGGGGATHIAKVAGLLSTLSASQANVLIVASGGGGKGNNFAGGSGGGISGTNGAGEDYGLGGTQTAGGARFNTCCGSGVGSFGTGGSASWSNEAIGGGGAGWYGASSGGGGGNNGAGGGGSSYIANTLLSTYGAITKAMYCYNCTTSSVASTLTYSTTSVSTTATSNYAKSGDGYAKITYISDDAAPLQVGILDNVRYVKDCINGSTVNAGNHWVELKAIKDGNNLAGGKTATGTSAITNVAYITDNSATSANYAELTAGSLQCITIDLGQIYDLNQITVWHYFADGRTYNSNVTYVSSNNSTWVTVMNFSAAETANGKTVYAN